MSFDLTNQYISQSFQQLTQISGSVLVNGTGSAINNLTVTASNATQALSASYAANVPVTASYAISASEAQNAQTATSASHAVQADSASTATIATTATSASRATSAASADTATSASHAVNADSASYVVTSLTASYVAGANVDGAVANASTASYVAAANVDGTVASATSASHAVQADSALSSNTATSASHAVNADTASFLPSSTRLNITDITASNASFTSASIGYLRQVTGSATIIGDEFIILNADVPAARYAGIKIYDSGSNATASLEWDGVNDYFIQQELDGNTVGIYHGPSGSRGSETFASNNHFLRGTGTPVAKDGQLFEIVPDPSNESLNTLYYSGSAISSDQGVYTTANGINLTLKAPDTNQTINIVNGASTVATFANGTKNIQAGALSSDSSKVASSGNIEATGSLSVGLATATGSITGFVDKIDLKGSGSGAGQIDMFSGSGVDIHIGANDNTSPGGGFGIHGDFADLNTRIYGNVDIRGSIEFNGNNTTVGDNTSFTINGGGSGRTSLGRDTDITGSLTVLNGDVTINNDSSNSVNISGSSFTTVQSGINNNTQRNFIKMPAFTKTQPPNDGSTFNLNNFTYADYSAFGAAYGAYEQAYMFEQWNAGNYNNGMETLMGAGRAHMFVKAPGSETAVKREALIGVLSDTDNFDSNNIVRCYGTTMEFGERNSYTINFGNNLHNVTVGHKTAEINLNSQHVNIGSAEGMSYTKIDGTTISFDTAQGLPTTDIDTWYTGSMILHQTGSLTAPALVISGSVQSTVDALSISSNTASLDCRASDFHTLTLVSGSDTFLNVNNVNAGQSFQVKVKQPGTSFGTLSYSSNVKFAGGTAPTITATSDAEDILTFTAFDGTNVYGTAVQNMS